MTPIEKPRRRRGGGRRSEGRRGRRRPGNRREKLRTEAEQLDYEMELLRAQREGRAEEFKAEERVKLLARKAATLDAEMDEYFKKKDEKPADEDAEKEAEPTSNGTDAKQETEPVAAKPAQPAAKAASG